MLDAAELALIAAAAGLSEAAVYLAAIDRPGPRIALDDGRAIYPASMIKVPLAIAATASVADGRRRFGDRFAVGPQHMTENDAPSPLRPGYAATLAELIDLMLQRSDNVATNVLFDALDRERATRDVEELGFPQTAFRRMLSGSLPLIDDPDATGRNTHPAREAADVFEAIARRTLPYAAIVHDTLLGQYWNDKLPAGLEPGDVFAHKTGDTDDVSHDGGILELADGGGRFVLVVYTERPSNSATDAAFAALMRGLRPRLVTP